MIILCQSNVCQIIGSVIIIKVTLLKSADKLKKISQNAKKQIKTNSKKTEN